MVAYTTTYNLKKPTVADDEDVWGGYLNDSMDIIDDVLDGTVPVTGIDINSGTIGNITIDGDLSFTDNTKAIFGAGSDLQIYHDGANSYVKDNGTGDLYLQGTANVRITNTSGQKMFLGQDGGEAQLYYSGAEKLATTSTGIDITGIADASTLFRFGADNSEIANNYLRFKPTGAAYIDHSTVGQVINVRVSNSSSLDTTPLVVSATGIDVTGNITVSGNVDGRDVAADGTKLDGIESGATADQTASEILTLIKTVDGAGSGLDADTLDGVSSGSFLRSDAADTATGAMTFNSTLAVGGGNGIGDGKMAVRGGDLLLDRGNEVRWNTGSGSGEYIYSKATGTYDVTIHSGSYDALQCPNTGEVKLNYQGSTKLNTTSSGVNINGSLNAVDNIYLAGTLYHEGDTNTSLAFGTDTITLYAGGSSEITVNTTGVRLGDTGNGYFRPVSGNYGSIEIDGGAHTGWEGYSIGGRVVFMHDNSNSAGIYNDVNNEWMLKCDLNGAVQLYHNNSSKLDTLSNGVSINGNLYTDGSNAEDWDSLSGTTPTCNVDNAGAFSLTMTGNTTFTFSGADSGWSMGFILQLTGNGSTVTWPASVDWAGGTAPDAPASGETDIYVFWTRDGGTTWYGVQSIDAAA